jgi:type III secretion protein J
MRHLAPALLTLVLAGCSSEEILHGLSEPEANEVLVALDEGGVSGEKRREEGDAAGWTVEVPRGDAARAQRLLADRELPRPRAPGFADVFGKGSLVPTPTEEHAMYLHALAGELSRSVEAIDGVVEARVHLGLPQEDPLRPGERGRPRAAVLLKCRPAACEPIHALEPGIRALVAGAADGLDPASVSVVIAPAAESRAPQARPAARGPARILLLVAAVGLTAAAALAATGVLGRLRPGHRSS